MAEPEASDVARPHVLRSSRTTRHRHDLATTSLPGGSRGAALLRYVVSATLARTADAGAAVGLVLLAVDPTTGVSNGALVGGVLGAGLTAPHLLGPWLAPRLDQTRDGRWVLAASFAVYGVALAAGGSLLGRAPLVLAAGAVVVAGMCGPLLTGGLSSRLGGIARSDHRSQRRAQGWDSVSYGLAGSAGPAAVAALAVLTTPLVAVLALAGAAIAAAVLTLTLPLTRPTADAGEQVMSVRAALRVMASLGPLRRVTSATALTAVSGGALPVVAVLFAGVLHAGAGAGAVLVAVFGLGNLTASLLITAFPLRGEPERLVTACAAGTAAAFTVCALTPTYPFALAAFALTGALSAAFFTATLAARSRYSPPGARAQVFISSAGLKVAAASAGTALAGAFAGTGPRTLLAAAAAISLTAAATTILDRQLTTRHHRADPSR